MQVSKSTPEPDLNPNKPNQVLLLLGSGHVGLCSAQVQPKSSYILIHKPPLHDLQNTMVRTQVPSYK